MATIQDSVNVRSLVSARALQWMRKWMVVSGSCLQRGHRSFYCCQQCVMFTEDTFYKQLGPSCHFQYGGGLYWPCQTECQTVQGCRPGGWEMPWCSSLPLPPIAFLSMSWKQLPWPYLSNLPSLVGWLRCQMPKVGHSCGGAAWYEMPSCGSCNLSKLVAGTLTH